MEADKVNIAELVRTSEDAGKFGAAIDGKKFDLDKKVLIAIAEELSAKIPIPGGTERTQESTVVCKSHRQYWSSILVEYALRDVTDADHRYAVKTFLSAPAPSELRQGERKSQFEALAKSVSGAETLYNIFGKMQEAYDHIAELVNFYGDKIEKLRRRSAARLSNKNFLKITDLVDNIRNDAGNSLGGEQKFVLYQRRLITLGLYTPP